MLKKLICGCLEIVREPEHPDYITVALVLDELSASRRVYSPVGVNREALSAFFSRIASNWRGWTGKQEWTSLEGDFSISCSHDGTRHVGMEIHLADLYRNWTVTVRNGIEIGKLEDLSKEAALFCLTD